MTGVRAIEGRRVILDWLDEATGRCKVIDIEPVLDKPEQDIERASEQSPQECVEYGA